jgi:hypothetical protein
VEITQEIKKKELGEKKLKLEASETLFRFSLNILTLSLLNKSLYELQPGNCLSQEIASQWYYLALLSVFLIFFSGYLRLKYDLGQIWVIQNIFSNRFFANIKYLGYVIILTLLGENILNVFKSDFAMLGFWGLVICWAGALNCLFILLRNTLFRNNKLQVRNVLDRL